MNSSSSSSDSQCHGIKVDGTAQKKRIITNGVSDYEYAASITSCRCWYKGQVQKSPTAPPTFELNKDYKPASPQASDPNQGPKTYATEEKAKSAVKKFKENLMASMKKSCGCGKDFSID